MRRSVLIPLISAFLFVVLIPISPVLAAEENTLSYIQEVKVKGGKTEKTRVFVQDNLVRFEPADGQGTVFIGNNKGMFEYDPEKKIAIKVKRSGFESEYFRYPHNFRGYTLLADRDIIGYGEAAGRQCRIISYHERSTRADVTAWVDIKNGFPLKMLIEYGDRKPAREVLFYEHKLDIPVSDQMFKIPPGTRIIEANPAMENE
jgi:outer membrane lipoprotein-sorting protein